MFTCISCRIAFETAEEQRSHFGTDWHRYNMKRRVANLPPVAAHAFNDKVIERREQNAIRPDPKGMFCAACSKAFSTENSYRSHVASKKHRDRETFVAHASDTAKRSISPGPETSSTTADAATAATPMDSDSDEADDDNEDENDDVDIEQRIAAARRRMGPGDCLFCMHHSEGIEENVSHMSRFHSFFIPDQDILVDLHGLIAYLGEKIALGNLCLFCPNGGREFGSVEAVRKHMIDKGHCKIAYDNDEDRAELADYYDFMGEGSDQSDWEDLEDGEASGSEVPTFSSDGLSLVLPSGRVLGHRSLKVYYSQRLRPASALDQDPTASKIQSVRQRLADPTSALVPIAGGHGAYGRGQQVMKARNAGEATWAKKQGKSFREQQVSEHFRTKVGFRNNSQKHFRDPLLQ